MDNELEGLVQLVLWGVCIAAVLVLGAQFVRGFKSAAAEKAARQAESRSQITADRPAEPPRS